MIIFFDIETISDFSIKQREQKKFSLLKEKYEDKLNFMPEYNKILCISAWYINSNNEIIIKSFSWSEENIIKDFLKAIWWNMIGWYNIKWFDLPFIIKRALKYKIEIPSSLKFFWKKPWELEHIIDLQEVYKNWVFSSFSSLDLVCNFLWITSPKNKWIDWSQVQEFYDNWKEKEIIKYCERDVNATIEVYNYFKQYNLI